MSETKELPRVVFLDIDGPVISTGCYGVSKQASMKRACLNTSALGYINMLCEKSGAKVVTNSTHNDDDLCFSGRNLRDDLIAWGLNADYIHEDWRTQFPHGEAMLIGGSTNRMAAISLWLHKNGPHDWVCFDDVRFTDDPRLIHINFDTGVTLNDMKEAFAIFGIRPPILLY